MFDAETGAPLDGASVSGIRKDGHVLACSEVTPNSYYECSGAEDPGVYTIKITKPGYLPLEQTFVMLASECGGGYLRSFTFRMEPE